MTKLPLSSIPRWTPSNSKWVPACIDTFCPHCGRLTNITVSDHLFDFSRNTVSATGRCPACSKESYFWAFGPSPAAGAPPKPCEAIYIYPNPRLKREPIVGSERLNPALARAYTSCLEAYNAGLWTPCAASCRRALESLVVSMLGDDAEKAPLYQQLKQLPEKVDLAKPLMLLVENLRKGGNISHPSIWMTTG